MGKFNVIRMAAIATVIASPLTAVMATDGYFSHGYGMKAKGMGGASVASADNAFAGANNPATAAWAGNRMEVGLDLFSPNRSMERTGSGAGLNTSVTSDSNLFYIPEFGYNRAVSDALGVGLTVYGNGGMNTDYAGGQTNCTGAGGQAGSNPLCGSGRLGIDLSQLIIAPTIAYKLNGAHSVGISPLFVQQQFKADGLQGFTSMSSAPGSLTNNGYDTSSGFGVRLGYLGKMTDTISVGASYAPKISMSKFDKYKGLFADGGNFDIPENYTIGASMQATPAVLIAFDYEYIKYSAVPSVGNASNSAGALGTATGKGFGWGDVGVVKLGVQWQATGALTMRAGLNVSDNPVKSRDVTFNVLAPGVVTTHYTLGGTYAISKETEVTFAYMYAPSNSVSGTSMYDGMLGAGQGGTETIKMSQQSFGIQYGWKF